MKQGPVCGGKRKAAKRRADRGRCPFRPPNRACGAPAHGSPVAPHPASRQRSYVGLQARSAIDLKRTRTFLTSCPHGRTGSPFQGRYNFHRRTGLVAVENRSHERRCASCGSPFQGRYNFRRRTQLVAVENRSYAVAPCSLSQIAQAVLDQGAGGQGGGFGSQDARAEAGRGEAGRLGRGDFRRFESAFGPEQ
jgi:hypothetical protein